MGVGREISVGGGLSVGGRFSVGREISYNASTLLLNSLQRNVLMDTAGGVPKLASVVITCDAACLPPSVD